MKSRLSNWREESDLLEAITGKMTDKEALKKVSEKKGINNKVTINPKLSEAVKEMGGELLEIAEIDKEGDKEDPKQAQIASKQKRAQMIKKQVLMKKLMAVRAGSEDIVAHHEPEGDVVEEEVGISSSAAMEKARKEAELKAKEEAAVKKAKKIKEEFEDVVEYFYAEGINEEGIDLIIEEVGLEEFVDFVDETQFLTEERDARKMNVRTLKATKKKAEEIKASKKDVVARGTPSDTLARARAERSLKKPKLAKPAAKKEAPTPVKKAAAVVKTARKATVAKAKKDFDGDGKVETPKSEHRGVRNKKITKAVAKAKPAQPKKPVSKDGLRAKIKSAYEAGVKRHRKATQPVRVFHKGMKAGAKKAVKFAKDVKKVVGEEVLDELKSTTLHSYIIKASGDAVKKGHDAGIEGMAGKTKEADKSSTKAYKRAAGVNRAAGKLALRAVKNEGFSNWRDDLEEAKVDTGSAAEKASARNLRNTPPGGNRKFDTSVFITRKPGESLDSARTRKRREAHAKKRGVSESRDRAVDIVRANIIKKHGEGAIYDAKRDKPTEAQKKAASAERKKRQDADNKAFAARAKKAGYKNPQDYANVVARYGSEDNYNKGRGLD